MRDGFIAVAKNKQDNSVIKRQNCNLKKKRWENRFGSQLLQNLQQFKG